MTARKDAQTWMQLYRQALQEHNEEQQMEMINLAEKAIQQRQNEIAELAYGSVEETRSLVIALANLRAYRHAA